MVKREKTKPPAQGVNESSRHGPRREVQSGLPELRPREEEVPPEQRPARLPEDVEERFRVR